jgi:hypothetical protein
MVAAREHLPRFTPEEYFAWEEQQLYRHEYIDGEVYAMSGSRLNHYSYIRGSFIPDCQTPVISRLSECPSRRCPQIQHVKAIASGEISIRY